jgi:hypothetical protein
MWAQPTNRLVDEQFCSNEEEFQMRVFNADVPKQELLRRVGNLAQVGSVQLLSHEEGYARGSRFLDFRTGSGFRFSVHVDRGMDPGYAEFNGASLAWLPPKLFPASAYWENDDHAWVRYVLGGLCNTAGLVTIGNPQTVDVSHFKFHSRHSDRYGTHDRIGIVPASHFTHGERWEGERCFLWAEGTVRQEIVYGENLVLTRRYEAEVGTSSFRLRDVVRNEGFYPTPTQLLYHFNIGYPVVDDGAELLASASGPVPGSIFDEAQGPSDRYRKFSGPEKGFFAEGFEIPMRPASDGRVGVAVVNRGFRGLDGGLGVFLRYDPTTLPVYLEWRMMGEGLYAVGMEPATNGFKTIPELIEAGYPVMLQPSEERVYQLEFGVLAGGKAIDDFAVSLPRAETKAV